MHNTKGGLNMKLIKRSVKDQIYDIMRERILHGDIALGEKINMLALSSELDVSNTPIREALSMLERDGLIEIKTNAGPSVIEYSRELFMSVQETVEALILGAFEIDLMNGRCDSLCDMLAATLEKQNQNLEDKDEYEYARISMEFDSCFIYCTGNPYIKKMYDGIEDIFHLVVMNGHVTTTEERHQVLAEHKAILLALRSGKTLRAKDLIRAHYSRPCRE